MTNDVKTAMTSTVMSTVTTVLVNNGGKIGFIVGVSVVYIPILALAIIILVIVLYMKRANNNKR